MNGRPPTSIALLSARASGVPPDAYDRRRILHVNVTPHPTSAWTRQQLREAFPNGANVRFLVHDRGTTFDAAFGRAVEAFGLGRPTAPHSPWQNPHVERVIGSIRRECLDHVIVFNERHLRRVLRTYVANGKPPDRVCLHWARL